MSRAPAASTGTGHATPHRRRRCGQCSAGGNRRQTGCPAAVGVAAQSPSRQRRPPRATRWRPTGPRARPGSPTTAANTTAITLSATHGNGSWARRKAMAADRCGSRDEGAGGQVADPRGDEPRPPQRGRTDSGRAQHSSDSSDPRCWSMRASIASATTRYGSGETHRSAGASPAVSTRRSPSRTLFSFNVIDSSSGPPPIRASRHRPTSAGAVSRRTRSTIDGISRPTSAFLGRARSTASDPSSPPPWTVSRHNDDIASPPVANRAVTVTRSAPVDRAAISPPWGWNQTAGLNVHSPMEFIREPRLPAPPVAHGEIAVESPPDIPKAVPGNPLARLMPVAMVVATGGMMALYFTSGSGAMRNPMFMFFPVMMLMSVVGTLAYGARGTNRTAELNEDRRDYLRYLDTVDDCDRQDRRGPASVTALAPSGARNRCGHWPVAAGCGSAAPRTLTSVTSGSGSATSRCPQGLSPAGLGPADEAGPRHTAALDRTLQQSVDGQRRADRRRPAWLCAWSPSTAVLCPRGHCCARSICQLAVLHSPETSRSPPSSAPLPRGEWEWLKWLPHHQHPRSSRAVPGRQR